ncbi:3-dehydroquinate synthase [bacterium]|nr:3-dehydroquinate synthase [bacterium]
MKKLSLNLGKNSYTIFIGAGILGSREIKKTISSFKFTKTFLLTNTTVARLYKAKIKKHFPQASLIIIPDGEKYKNSRTMDKIYNALAKGRADRKSGLIALGGGVVGDMGGFAAASFMRGIPYIQIPTTLLSQVDSSVGGKTGIDLPSGKNLVGAFYQPRAVFIDTDFLKTLPKREFLCGLAEVIKYGMIWDKKFFDYLKNSTNEILKCKTSVLEKIIHTSCTIKAKVVEKDEKESNLRAILNFGHTMGHAAETLSGFSSIHHGEAVAMGMVYAAFLSEKKKLCPKGTAVALTTLLKKIGLPVNLPRFSKARYAKTIALDKKAKADTITYVTIKQIGKAHLVDLKPHDIVRYL